MPAKPTLKNQVPLQKSITDAVDAAEYVDVEASNGEIALTPARIQRGNAVRAKLAELDLQGQDIAYAGQWTRSARNAEQSGEYYRWVASSLL